MESTLPSEIWNKIYEMCSPASKLRLALASKVFPYRKPKIFLFYTTWCFHSRRMMPTWDQMKINMKAAVDVIKVDPENENVESHHFDASGNDTAYPTIRFVYEEQKWDYKGARTVEGLLAFVKEHFD